MFNLESMQVQFQFKETRGFVKKKKKNQQICDGSH